MSAAPGALEAAGQFGELPFGRFTRRVGAEVRKRSVYAIAAAILLLVAVIAVFGPMLPLADPQAPSLLDRLQPPLSHGSDGTMHLAGTDQLGRDVLSRTVRGARVSVGIALATAFVSGTIGSILGLVAGYRGGWVDQLVMRLVDLQMAFPAMLLAIFLLYLIGSSVTNLVILLTIFSWAGFARVARAETLRVRNLAFVEGAEAVGATTPRILFFHIFPHLIPVLSVLAVFDFAGVMLAESSLSFLGLGIQPPGSSWGLMLAESRDHLYTGGWWLFVIPGAALFSTTLSANLTSRWIQELMRIRE
ncbi:MAG: ABC transporter permease [Dehalococcoidia bacterium]